MSSGFYPSDSKKQKPRSLGTKVVIMGLVMLIGGSVVVTIAITSTPNSFESDRKFYSENIHPDKQNFRILVWSQENVIAEFEISPSHIPISVSVLDEKQQTAWTETFSDSIKDSFSVEPGRKYFVSIKNFGSEYITLKGKLSSTESIEPDVYARNFSSFIIAIAGIFVIIGGLIVKRLEKPVGVESKRTWSNLSLKKRLIIGFSSIVPIMLIVVIAGGTTYLTHSITCFGDEITIMGTEQPDFIEGTSGNDVIYGDRGGDIIYGLEGDDKICGSNGDDYIIGGPGNDKIESSLGNDILEGNDGDDVLDGYGGNDVMDGGLGIDKCIDGGSYKNCEN